MSDIDPKESEFSEIWETLQLQDEDVGVAHTQTMKPSSQTRISADRGAPFARNLPRIRCEEESAEEMAELDLRESLGEGGTAEIVRADQVPLNREVAVKKLREDSTIEGGVYVLLHEAWVTGALEHPNIVPVYRLGRADDGDPVIVMKRIEGVSWEEVLRDPSAAPREMDVDDPLDWHLEVLMDVCDAIHYAHSRSIIHRDLKPENVMVGAFGEVYVVDWGLAVSVADDASERLPRADDIDEPAGTPVYMAPEMAEGDGSKLCLQTDVYLLGAILHHIVTGSPPHDDDSLYASMLDAYTSEAHEYGPEVPDGLADICQKAMAHNPADRYATAEEFRKALANFKQHRRAAKLTRRAERRLDDLRETLEDPEPDEALVYEAFGECRFGFEQALEVDPNNDRAREGLQAVMERMIEWQFSQKGFKAASLLISDLPEPNPELEERLDHLRQQQADREREYEKLKEFERQQDVDRGRKTRSLLVLAMGVIMGTSSYAPGVMRSALGFDLGVGDLFLQMLVVGAVVAGGLWVGRHRLLQNTANRQLVASLLWICAGVVFFRKAVVKTGIDPGAAIPFQMLSVSVAAGVIGACIDRRVFWAAVPFFLGSYLAAEFSAFAHAIDASTDVVAMGLLALVWWPGQFEKLTDLPLAGVFESSD